MKIYKLTTVENKTRKGRYNETRWGKEVTVTIPKEERKNVMCGEGILHAYTNINLALLMNPIHADFAVEEFNIWEAEGELVADGWDKCGCHQLTTVRQLDIPLWFIDEETRKDIIVMFAVLCAEAVLHVYEKEYPEDNRPRKAISIAREYLNTKSMDALWGAAETAEAAVRDVWVVWAADAVWAAAGAAARTTDAAVASALCAAARAASRAASRAARAASSAARVSADIDFCLLADQAVDTIMNKK
jgi:hypothetical protein